MLATESATLLHVALLIMTLSWVCRLQALKGRRGTKEHDRFCSSCGSNSTLEHSHEMMLTWVLVLSFLSSLLSCVVLQAYKHTVTTHKHTLHYVHTTV